jgi:hypothetical protein
MADEPISDRKVDGTFPEPSRPDQPLPENLNPPDRDRDKTGRESPDQASTPITEFHIGEEFGTAKRTLPPAGIVLICIAAVAVVIGLFAFKERPKPQGAGAINFVAAAPVPEQNIVLVALTITLRNTAERPLWIHTLKAQLTTADDATQEDEAASVVDLDRYFSAFPALKESAEPPLSPETKMPPGSEKRGTIIVSFKGTKEAFDQRKSLSVSIQPYDQPLPIVLK